jgi:hypothetical protein
MPYALDLIAPTGSNGRCPYHGTDARCRAAASGLSPDRRRIRNYCACEDYDLCLLYLSKALRSSRPRYCGASRHDLSQK